MGQKKRTLRASAKAAVRTPIAGGRTNRNRAMGPKFANDIRGTIADQMRLPPKERLAVRRLYFLVRDDYPTYPNHYSAFRVWILEAFGYRGGATKEEDILFDLADFPALSE